MRDTQMRNAAVPVVKTPANRRAFLLATVATTLALALSPARAQNARMPFDQWINAFRAKAVARGVSEDTYNRVMGAVKPDTGVYALVARQDEFAEQLWQYLNRRVSDWRITTGKERAKQYAPLLDRIEQDYGVDRYILLALWGIESGYGDVVNNRTYMRPVIPALAALAWGEPRRRAYWEQELINALTIVDRGWSTPEEMIGSWAGAMGHTQWMPEVWLHVGVDYDQNGRINPFGDPQGALAGTARYLVERGGYRRGEAWGCEVRAPAGREKLADRKTWRTYAQWQDLGVVRPDGTAFPRPSDRARLALPVPGGPGFLIGQNFSAAMSYNPAFSYALAIVHLADRIRGDGPFVQPFPGSEPTPTIAELQELQRRLTALGFDTGGTDGRVGRATMQAVRDYQRKFGIEPADGYAGVGLLARLRAAS
jgi:membrane-bound lytic murein transglycosylase B